ncbi:hypothetical protein [Streptomyces sp. NPDC046939]|uniref:hypothetical protein n=1 Tax=Streptomyces sp. NPDC046939 TaxID=3155376 RepID=UPI0033C79CEF
MGIESDQLVFDYLSRVGDLAQQRQLPSATRMRLVSELRGEIDRRRAKVTVDSPAAVRRIIDRLGDPDRIVSGAQEGGGASGADPAASLVRPVPEQPGPEARGGDGKGGGGGKSGGMGKLLRKVPPQSPQSPQQRDDVPSPPHLAGTDELGSSRGETDWWRVGVGQSLADTDPVPGFTGGIEIPEILRPPGAGGGGADLRKPVAPVEVGGAGAIEKPVAEGVKSRRFVPEGGLANPLLLLAAAALVAGAVLGNLLVLLFGWAVVYLSRRLTPGQKKWAVFVVPGLAAAGGIGWLWGRSVGKWGAPIAEGEMSGAVGETWPWVLRCAAVASALYLVWRSQRTAR